MFRLRTAQADFGAPRRSVRVDPTIGCVTIHCVSSEEMWVVLLGLDHAVTPLARVKVSTTFRRGDADARRLGGEANPLCTITEVEDLLDALERGECKRAADLLSCATSVHETPARFRCGVHPRVGVAVPDR